MRNLWIRAISALTTAVAAMSFATPAHAAMLSIRGGTVIHSIPQGYSGNSVLGQAGIGIAGGQIRVNGTLDILSDEVTLTLYDVGSESHWENQIRLGNRRGLQLVDDDDHWRTVTQNDIYIHSPIQLVGSVSQDAGTAQLEFWGYIGSPAYKIVLNGQSPMKLVTNYQYAGIAFAYLNGQNQIVTGPTDRILVLLEDGGMDQDFDDYVGIIEASQLPASPWGSADLRVQARPITGPVHAFVTVEDADGQPVQGLNSMDISLLEDGDLVVTPTFALPSEQSNRHLSVVIAADNTDSAQQFAGQAVEDAIISFIEGMKDGDYAAIVKFNDSDPSGASVVQPFVPVGGAGTQLLLDSVTADYFPGSGTSLYDAALLSIEQLQTVPLPNGPKAVVILTAGADNSSMADVNDVVALANVAGVPLFIVAVGEAGSLHEQALAPLAFETSGDYFPAPTDALVTNASLSIIELLSNEYLMTFATVIGDCDTHTLEVRASIDGNVVSDTRPFTRCTPLLVPNLLGMTPTEAAAAVARVGLTLGNWTEQPDAAIPAGGIASQSPTAGTSVSGLTFVNYVVSTGPPPGTVPNVAGLVEAEAISTIADASLMVGSISEQSSDSVPSGSVISQSPSAGTILPPGSSVSLVVSSGPALAAVPNVTGVLHAAAINAITEVSLIVGSISEQSSDSVPADTVISQTPSAGTLVLLGSSVDLLVSSGPAPVLVPNVTGVVHAAAINAITEVSLIVGSISEESSDSVPAGTVISQTPSAGTLVPPGSSVNLVVSSGPAPVLVPNVTGVAQAAAINAITEVSLIVGSISEQSSDSVPAGTVISQTPSAGTLVPPGSSLNLVVSSGPAPVLVPNVTDIAQAAAVTAIANASLVLGSVTGQSSSSVPLGSVISQTPSAGTLVPCGSSVDLAISSGPTLAVVPNLTGLAQSAAISAIVNASLVLGSTSEQSSDSVPLGYVISQSPSPGMFAPPGSSVNLVLSSGPMLASPPTLSLSAAPTSILAGDTSMLTWSSSNATECTAGGGWSGSRATRGSYATVLYASAAFTLTCRGPGGTETKTVNVSVTPQAIGGGGAIDHLALLVLLISAVGYRVRRIRGGCAP